VSVIVVCGCGASFEAKRKSKYGRCPACALRAKRIRQDRWRTRQCEVAVSLEVAFERGVKRLVVVLDPLERGGFREGTEFHQEEWEQMVRHLSFTPGTLLMDGQRRLYEFRLGTAGSRYQRQTEKEVGCG
jgi:hypothetical protein